MQMRPTLVRSFGFNGGSFDRPNGGGDGGHGSGGGDGAMSKVRHKKTLKKTELCLFDMQNGSCPRGGGYPAPRGAERES